MAIDLPVLDPLTANVRPLDFSVVQTPPLGGVSREYARLGSRHAVDLSLGYLDADCAGRFIAARNKAKATGATVRARFPQPDGLGSSVTGVTVNGGSQSGRLLNIGGLPTTSGRTNLLLHSQDFPTGWTQDAITVSANVAAAPDGTTTADKLVPSSGAGQYIAYQAITFSGIKTLSVYAKKGELTRLGLGNYDLGFGALFDLDAGAVVHSLAGTTASIQSVGGGFYRCIVTTPSMSSASYIITVWPAPATKTTFTAAGVVGDNVKGAYAWGAQLEAGSSATDYIATTTAAVTVYPTLIKAGAAFSVIVSSRSYLYTVTDDLVGSASATGQIGLDGLLRASPANGAALEFVNPVIEGWLQGAQDWTIEGLIATALNITIAEAA